MRAASFVVYTIRCHLKKKKRQNTWRSADMKNCIPRRKIIHVISYCFVVDVELVLFERGKQHLG